MNLRPWLWILLTACVAFGLMSIKSEVDFQNSCRAAGGDPFITRIDHVCLAPGAVVDMKPYLSR
jgi:hypothetical protein